MSMLTKNDVLKKRDLRREIVAIPEWGGSLYVQEMTALQRDRFEEWVLNKGDNSPKGTRVAIIINTVVDEDGQPMFSDLDAADLGNKPADIIDRIAGVGLKLSGMSDAVVEEERKNSEAVLEDGSSLDSAES